MSKTKPETLYFTCTPELAGQIRAAATRDGLSVASWMRQACSRALPRNCACGAALLPGARFCAACGTPTIPGE